MISPRGSPKPPVKCSSNTEEHFCSLSKTQFLFHCSDPPSPLLSLSLSLERSCTRTRTHSGGNLRERAGESERRRPYVTRGRGGVGETRRVTGLGRRELKRRLAGWDDSGQGGTVVSGHSLLREGKEDHTASPTQVVSSWKTFFLFFFNFPLSPCGVIFLSNEISLNDVMQTKLVS